MQSNPAIPYGPDAVLVPFAERVDGEAFRRGRRLAEFLGATCGDGRPPGTREWVPGFHRLLLRVSPGDAAGALGNWRAEVEAFLAADDGTAGPPGAPVTLPVVYDGPDLDAVSVHAGLSRGEVIDRHAGGDYRVHCLGFSPGFPYLGGLDPSLQMPRRSVPRTRIDPGSVAIGGEHTGVYTVASPGGWHLIGRCRVPLFDPAARSLNEMFRVRAGDRVRFLPVSPEDAAASGLGTARSEAAADRGETVREGFRIRVISPGLGLTVQDGGRRGHGRFGVAPGGCLDPVSAMWANRLVDNPAGTPVLELCLQGQDLLCLADGWLAVAGAATARGRGSNRSFRVRAGERIRFDPGPAGVWSYVAVPGGWDAPSWLGSRSAHVRAGIGWIGSAGVECIGRLPAVDPIPHAVAGRLVPWEETRPFDDPPTLRVWPGPQWRDFPGAERERFLAAAWEVTARSDRVGYRLAGPTLAAEPAHIVSEPVLPGSIQVPAGGQPIVTLADGPTLGGYPKIALIDPEDLVWLVQTRPGQRVRFRLAAGG